MSDAFVAAAAACSHRRFYAAEKAWLDQSYAKFSKLEHSRIAHRFVLDPTATPWFPKIKKKTVSFDTSAQITGYSLDEEGLVGWAEAKIVPLGTIPEILHPGRLTYGRGQGAVPPDALVLWKLRPDLLPSEKRQRQLLDYLDLLEKSAQ